MIIQQIAKSSGIEASYLRTIVSTASHRYKIYKIPKKTGGEREIHHPSRELKYLQRWLVDNVFAYLPVHEAVFSYRDGKSIRDLAKKHANSRYMLRLDFASFFPSIVGSDVVRLLKNNVGSVPISLTTHDLMDIRNIVCRFGRLTIGAPSSPVISNAILFEFDNYIYSKCKQIGIRYTRYADDLIFSSQKTGVLSRVEADVIAALKHLPGPKLAINDKKTVFSSGKNRRKVVGLVITSEKKISIGRDKKRYVKSLVYKYINGILSADELVYLRGYLAFVNSVEPEFLAMLSAKYGSDKIRLITHPV
ncbi:MAG: RNA-directed DNA polymerase [Gammaproteobacteria bacterium]|nr:RNA-directed DNA polymerase [Gammaproteobacteria bacterium]